MRALSKEWSFLLVNVAGCCTVDFEREHKATTLDMDGRVDNTQWTPDGKIELAR